MERSLLLSGTQEGRKALGQLAATHRVICTGAFMVECFDYTALLLSPFLFS